MIDLVQTAVAEHDDIVMCADTWREQQGPELVVTGGADCGIIVWSPQLAVSHAYRLAHCDIVR